MMLNVTIVMMVNGMLNCIHLLGRQSLIKHGNLYIQWNRAKRAARKCQTYSHTYDEIEWIS